jgi:tRNA pseudouridine38-40 synthase
VSASTAVRYRATIEYDGSGFSGYQVQPRARTVQGAIESSLSRIMDRPMRVQAAGRTDTGVHAVGQEIAFDAPTPWDEPELTRSLNAVLPNDVAIYRLRPAEPDFHPRFAATGRRYEYFVGPPAAGPLRFGRVWSPPEQPELAKLVAASFPLVGEGSFEALSKAGQPHLGTRCVVESAEWTRTGIGDLRFTIVADRFLHRMVRYIVATLVEIGTGRRDPGELAALLDDSGARPPEPAPARGLYLTGVRYGDGWNRDPGVPGLWPVPEHDETAETA